MWEGSYETDAKEGIKSIIRGGARGFQEDFLEVVTHKLIILSFNFFIRYKKIKKRASGRRKKQEHCTRHEDMKKKGQFRD